MMSELYTSTIRIETETNRQLMEKRVKSLRIDHGQKHGLKDKAASPLIRDTILKKRKICISYNAESLEEENTVLFTGQCLLKEDEDLECPVTLDDAIECATLRHLLETSSMPAICMYPDSVYKEFVLGWSGKEVGEREIELATEKFMAFRRRMLPDRVEHVRTSEVEEQINSLLPENFLEQKEILKRKIRRIYGGRVLSDGQEHHLQEVILNYGIKTIILPVMLGYKNKDVVLFAEPQEVCSVYAAELASKALNRNIRIGLLGQLPVPSLTFLIDKKIDMYSAGRDSRIHLNEPDNEVRRKLEERPTFCLLSLYLSPLTTEEQLQEIGKSKDRKIGIDLMIEQIRAFRGYL